RWPRDRMDGAPVALSLQAIGSESLSERPFRDGAPRCLNIRLRTAFLHHLRRSELTRCWLMAGNDAHWVSGLANRGAILTLLHRFGGTCTVYRAQHLSIYLPRGHVMAYEGGKTIANWTRGW